MRAARASTYDPHFFYAAVPLLSLLPLRPASNAVDAVDAALRSVLLGLCHPEDLQMLTRLVDQVRPLSPLWSRCRLSLGMEGATPQSLMEQV